MTLVGDILHSLNSVAPVYENILAGISENTLTTVSETSTLESVFKRPL